MRIYEQYRHLDWALEFERLFNKYIKDTYFTRQIHEFMTTTDYEDDNWNVDFYHFMCLHLYGLRRPLGSGIMEIRWDSTITWNEELNRWDERKAVDDVPGIPQYKAFWRFVHRKADRPLRIDSIIKFVCEFCEITPDTLNITNENGIIVIGVPLENKSTDVLVDTWLTMKDEMGIPVGTMIEVRGVSSEHTEI